MSTRRTNPGARDRKGVGRPRVPVSREKIERVGIMVETRTRQGEQTTVFGAHTPETLAAIPDYVPPLPTRPPRLTQRDVAPAHVPCHCGAIERTVYAHVAASGWKPTCERSECAAEAARVKRERKAAP